jgi:two-component system sensor histidine kinase KdpD
LKSALLDALTHNLRTPLTSIKAAVTALIALWERTTDLSVEARRELLAVIDEESDRLNRFIEGLSTPDLVPVSTRYRRASRVEDLVQAALLRSEPITRNHEIVVELEGTLPSVSVEPASIVEVLYILLDNASKYSAAGTPIVVRAAQTDDGYVRASVSDGGPGIPPELRERVFEKFFRAPIQEFDDRRPGGIGLGLPIARSLIETQAGRLWIEETPHSRGATVVMTLPVAPEANDAAPEPRALAATT